MDSILFGILVIMSLGAVVIGLRERYTFITYFGFALLMLVGIILFGEGFTDTATSFVVVENDANTIITVVDSRLTTSNSPSVNILANIVFLTGLLGILSTLLMYKVNNKTGRISG